MHGLVADDRWWRGFDSVIYDAVAPGARVLDVGCGDGALVERLAARGLEALGVDPRAPQHPRLVQQRVEEADTLGRFDAVCAIMTLHHAELKPVLSAITRLLHPGGRLFAYEFAWEAYDQRAADWLAQHDPSEAENSVAAWELEHDDLHTNATIRSALTTEFAIVSERRRPYLARMLRRHDLEQAEQRLIEAGALPALGRCYVAHQR
jgi:SAM-dependent methyltransferase